MIVFLTIGCEITMTKDRKWPFLLRMSFKMALLNKIIAIDDQIRYFSACKKEDGHIVDKIINNSCVLQLL